VAKKEDELSKEIIGAAIFYVFKTIKYKIGYFD
jgi:hypothetical protein